MRGRAARSEKGKDGASTAIATDMAAATDEAAAATILQVAPLGLVMR